MEINRRALYNALRMNWVLDPTLEVESWQVEDYRSMPTDLLFEKLEEHRLHLEKSSFLAYAETVDSPEELTDALLAGSSIEAKIQDQVYLLIFELWRRLLPEKPCLSIFCDEIDHQIHLYDRGDMENGEAMQDALANLQVILDENVDEGAKPLHAFDCINASCAHDMDSFLYDFIAEQIDLGNYPYANELLDGFSRYIRDAKWFDFLRARVISHQDPEEADSIIKRLIEKSKSADLSFNLEILSFLVTIGDQETFERLAKKTIDLLKIEEDFQNLLSISADFYHRLDHDPVEQRLQNILDERLHVDLHKVFDAKDTHLTEFLHIITDR